jgi:tetratricopeptide (TPR) repeat protein
MFYKKKKCEKRFLYVGSIRPFKTNFMRMKIIFKITILLFILLPVNQLYSQDTQKEKFDKAADLYSGGKYKEALDTWMSLYNSGIRSASLDYNIANTNFKLNNIPGAILFYERALLLKPADEDLVYNLQIARTLVVDKFNEIPELFFIKWYNFIALSLQTNTWAKISIISFFIFLVALSLYIYSQKYRYKVIGFWLALFLLLLSISSISFSIRNKNLVYFNPKAIIFSPLVNGKSSPDNSGKDLFVLHEGTKVTVEDEVGGWYEIRLSDGNKGWVPSNSLEKI